MASDAPHDPPFRADHVGSLLRPPELLKARADRAAGRVERLDLHVGVLRGQDRRAFKAVRRDRGLSGERRGQAHAEC